MTHNEETRSAHANNEEIRSAHSDNGKTRRGIGKKTVADRIRDGLRKAEEIIRDIAYWVVAVAFAITIAAMGLIDLASIWRHMLEWII
jgi:hypothetical protein